MPASKAKQAQVAERRKKAVAMKLAGADWDAITNTLGYPDRHTACKDVRRAMEANIREQSDLIEELRAVEIARYDRLQAAFWPKAIGEKDHKAAEVVLKCIAGRNKLTGTEVPVRAEHSGPGGGPIAFSAAEMDEFEALLTAGDVPEDAADSESPGVDGD